MASPSWARSCILQEAGDWRRGHPKLGDGAGGWRDFTVTLLHVTDVLLLLSSRLRGFFVAPQTNNYTFWIQADGQASLYLSLSEDPGNKVLLLVQRKIRR